MTTDNQSALHDRDRIALRFVHRTNIRLRAVLCTLARRGVAIRETEPERGRQILAALAPWPFYKGGQFLFDLFEWEDLMLDGDPPTALSHGELVDLLDLPVRWLTATVTAADTPTPAPLAVALPVRLFAATARSAFRDITRVLAPPRTIAPAAEPGVGDTALPSLQGGFYLYQDVVLGLFDIIGPRLPGPAVVDASPRLPEQEKVTTKVFPIEETFLVTDNKGLKHDWSLHGDATLAGEDGLQLTPNEHDRAGTALLNQPFPSTAGVTVEFDYYAEGGNGDGFAVYLIDGAHDTGVGGYGAGLGYARGPDGASNGVTMGWIGIGFDSWGNYSTSLAGPYRDNSRQPNRIVLRGSGDKATGFDLIDGVAIDGGLNAVWEDKAHVRVVITNAVLSVFLTRGDNTATVFEGLDLKLAKGQDAMPETFKLGLSASTGGETSLHCLRNLVIAMPEESTEFARN